MKDLTFASACDLAYAIRERKVSSMEVLEAHLAQIARHNPSLNAIVTLDEDNARRHARAADEALAQSEQLGPLHGVPFTLKDVIDTAGLRTMMGHAPLADRVPMKDHPVAARLKAAGGVLVGKTNVEIFPDNPFGATNNPWDLERTPGTSSSGAAAAVAAGMTPLDIGSDVGGSVIVPAHYSGVYGLRPTERRVPVGSFPSDPVPLWRIMGVLGPLARSVADLRLALQVVAGPDPDDTEVPPIPWRDVPRVRIRDLRIAWSADFPNTRISRDARTAVIALAQELARLGARVEERLPTLNLIDQSAHFDYLWDLTIGAFGKPPSKFGDYLTALHTRDTFIAGWDQFLSAWDVFLCPPKVDLAPRHADASAPLVVDGEIVPAHEHVDPSRLACVTGHPVVVIPLAHGERGLPIGVQLMGRRWDDERLLAIAERLEEVTGGFRRPPGY